MLFYNVGIPRVLSNTYLVDAVGISPTVLIGAGIVGFEFVQLVCYLKIGSARFVAYREPPFASSKSNRLKWI